MYSVQLSESCRRFFELADEGLQRKLDRCFRQLRTSPRRHPNIKPLEGQFHGCYRYRVGDYRVVYWIDESSRSVNVVVIAHRSRAYG